MSNQYLGDRVIRTDMQTGMSLRRKTFFKLKFLFRNYDETKL